MVLSEQQAEKLLGGEYEFSLWSFAALVTLLKQQFAGNPSGLTTYTIELNAFITKYAHILGSDTRILENL